MSPTGFCRGGKWRCPVGSWVLSWGFGKWWAGEINLGVISMQMRLDEIAKRVRADGKGGGKRKGGEGEGGQLSCLIEIKQLSLKKKKKEKNLKC